jgi:hypothetical protein
MQEFKLPRLFNWQLASQRIPYNIFSAKIDVTIISTNSGLLEVGKQYIIQNLETGDDFTNVGFPVGAIEGIFTATGTTPTDWTNGTVVINKTDSQLAVNKLQDTIGVAVALEFIPYNVQPPELVITFRKTNGFPESKFWKADSTPIRVDNSLVVRSPGGSNRQYEFRVYNT